MVVGRAPPARLFDPAAPTPGVRTDAFATADGDPVTAVTAAEMRQVDRVAVEEVGLSLTRMMEHAGRALALEVLALLAEREGTAATVLAGAGGNGGGGLACARHLRNRGVAVTAVLDRPAGDVGGTPGENLAVLTADGLEPVTDGVPDPAGVVVDALVGYGLDGEPRGRVADLVAAANDAEGPVVSLDVPTGVDATDGSRPGVTVAPDRTLTLALPKTGLVGAGGDLVLADLSIPGTVYDRVGVPADRPFGDGFRVALQRR